MNENMNYPVLEFEDCINYIVDKTKLDRIYGKSWYYRNR